MSTITFSSAVMAGLLGSAFDYCVQMMGLPGREAALAALQRGDCAVCESLRSGMAAAVAEYLGSVDDTVKAVYSYNPERATSTDEPVSALGINLIAWVTRKSAALSSVADVIRTELAEAYTRLGCPKANALCYALDVQVVDDDEVRDRTGYGALIHSLYVRPQRIWQR